MTLALPLPDGARRLPHFTGDSGGAAAGFDLSSDCIRHATTLLRVTRTVNHVVTLGNVTRGNVRGMDQRWTECREPWERVRWARSQKFPDMKSAADSLGMKEGTYRAYERRPDTSKSTALSDQAAIRFGKKFGVDWIWLLRGEGSPMIERPSEAFARIQRALVGKSNEDAELAAAVIETMFDPERKTGSSDR